MNTVCFMGFYGTTLSILVRQFLRNSEVSSAILSLVSLMSSVCNSIFSLLSNKNAVIESGLYCSIRMPYPPSVEAYNSKSSKEKTVKIEPRK